MILSNLISFLIIPSIFAGIIVAAFLINFYLKRFSLTVTDKRVYGTVFFDKRVDLPNHMISAVGTTFPKGIHISTSSGRISFLFIKNRNEIHKVLSNLIVEMQNRVSMPTPQPSTYSTQPQASPQTTTADELMKYKSLLDAGAITEEEYNEKKKQLLGL